MLNVDSQGRTADFSAVRPFFIKELEFMDCIEIICLYLKRYLSAEQFQTIVYAHLHAFEHALPEPVYLDLLSATFCTKEETIHLETELRNDVLRHHPLLYDKINDAFMEHWIAANPGDTVTEILKKRDEKRAEVFINCSSIRSASELIYTFMLLRRKLRRRANLRRKEKSACFCLRFSLPSRWTRRKT